jgi:hypothetical protein
MEITVVYSEKIRNPFVGRQRTLCLQNMIKKTLLATALSIIVQPVNAGVKSLSTDEMQEVVGQAGLSIDLSPEIEDSMKNLSDYQIALSPLGLISGNVALAGVAAAASASMGLTGAADYEELLWSVDFVTESDGSSALLDKWGAFDNELDGTGYHVISIGDHGEVEQSLDEGDMIINSGKSVHGFASLEDHNFTVRRSMMGETRFSNRKDINEKVRWGDWDVVFDLDKKSINLNAYIEAERSTFLDFLGLTVDVKVHNSRGKDQYIVASADGEKVASFAHFQADISPNDENGGVNFNIQDFSGDVDYRNIQFGSGESIGDVYITDFSIKADMNIRQH